MTILMNEYVYNILNQGLFSTSSGYSEISSILGHSDDPRAPDEVGLTPGAGAYGIAGPKFQTMSQKF